MRNEKGMMVIALAAASAALVGVLMIMATQQFTRMTSGYRNAEGKRFAEEIANDLAVKIRAAYDMANTDPNNLIAADPVLCVAPNAIVNSSGGTALCLNAADPRVCSQHPVTEAEICVDPAAAPSSLVQNTPSKWDLFKKLFAPDQANAQAYSPAPPVWTGTTALPAFPLCARENCMALPGNLVVNCANSTCVTFTFCPLVGGNCRADQRVIQTIAFFR